jgi:hypothetical protein
LTKTSGFITNYSLLFASSCAKAGFFCSYPGLYGNTLYDSQKPFFNQSALCAAETQIWLKLPKRLTGNQSLPASYPFNFP